jgi:undecaprenyl-diphosphatase
VAEGFGQPAGEAETITPAQAVTLGVVQGPTELLPVSSSAHLSLIPWFAGWDWDDLDPEVRKSFQIALHGGTAAALLLGQRATIAAELSSFDRRRATVLLLSFLPPAVVGYGLERPITRRLGGPLPTAIGLLVGAALMALADRVPQSRGRGQVEPLDGLLLGLAQASALIPGISRNGATLAAARGRGFSREQANLLSRTVALPVIVGAAALKAVRLRKRGLPPAERRAFAAGTAASFGSSVASQALIRLVERDRALWPYAAYRAALAGLVLARLGAEAARRSREAVVFQTNGGPPTGNGTRPPASTPTGSVGG